MTSNNQRVKRAQIVAAAKDVLATQGLAACTARAVADASPLTKSAIHYYFNDIDEIVDEAMAEHVAAMVTNLRRVAATAPPGERLWRVVEAYLATFAELPHAAFLWFEYWVAASRRQRVDGVAGLLDQVRDLLIEVLGEEDQAGLDRVGLNRAGPDRAGTVAGHLHILTGSCQLQDMCPRFRTRVLTYERQDQ